MSNTSLTSRTADELAMLSQLPVVLGGPSLRRPAAPRHGRSLMRRGSAARDRQAVRPTRPEARPFDVIR